VCFDSAELTENRADSRPRVTLNFFLDIVALLLLGDHVLNQFAKDRLRIG